MKESKVDGKLTLTDMRDVDAAYRRGEKYAMERLGDGAIRLRKVALPENHDRIEADLSSWLSHDNFNLRAPGVCENLFRLSDYLSGRLPVPSREVLTFLHAYIFALEGLSCRRQNARDQERKKMWKPRKLPTLPRKLMKRKD